MVIIIESLDLLIAWHMYGTKKEERDVIVAFNFFNSTGIIREDKHCVIVRLEPIL